VHRQLRQGRGKAGHRGRIASAVAVGERLSAAVGLVDRGLAWRLVEVVEDLPERRLDLDLVGLGDLGEQVAGAVKP
jgi:hypothetical protein